MSQTHLFGTHDGIFSTFVYVLLLFLVIYGGRLLERGVYRIFLGLYWVFIGEGRLKESGCLLEKIQYLLQT